MSTRTQDPAYSGHYPVRWIALSNEEAMVNAPGTGELSLIATRPSGENPVCVVGPVFLDIIMTGLAHGPRPGEEQWVESCAMMPGGSANQAVALARLGLPVALRSRLGTDDAGALVRGSLAKEGISAVHCETVPAQNVTVSLAFDGDRAMTTVGSDDAPTLDGLGLTPSVLVADLRAVGANRATVAAWRSAPEATCVVGDVGWDATGRWDPADLAPLDQVDVFVPNDAEALRYTRTDAPEDAARALAERVRLAVVTCGPRGVVACRDGEVLALPATPVVPVDTTGAGDSFSAGLVWALAHDLPLRAALSLASLTASSTLDRPGGSANAPTLAEVAAHARSLELPEDYDLSFLDLLDAADRSPKDRPPADRRSTGAQPH